MTRALDLITWALDMISRALKIKIWVLGIINWVLKIIQALEMIRRELNIISRALNLKTWAFNLICQALGLICWVLDLICWVLDLLSSAELKNILLLFWTIFANDPTLPPYHSLIETLENIYSVHVIALFTSKSRVFYPPDALDLTLERPWTQIFNVFEVLTHCRDTHFLKGTRIL